MTEESEIRPLQPIRRFDVFAETKRLEALAHGEPDDVAKGYGIRIAKIVASRRFGGSAPRRPATRKTTPKASHRPGADSAVRVAPSSAPSTASSSPTRRSTGRSSTAWVPSFTRLCFNRRFGRRWPPAASTNRSGTPSAKTGSRRGADSGESGPDYRRRPLRRRWLSRRGCFGFDRGRCRRATLGFRADSRQTDGSTSEPDRLVGIRGNQPADDRPHPVDPPVREVLLDDRRSERPRRVHRGAGDAASGQDVHGDDQADRQRRDRLRTARIDDGPEDDQ